MTPVQSRLEAVLAALSGAALPVARPLEAVAIDGKALRGSRKQGAPGVHLLSALSQRLGLMLAQCGVDEKTNEIGAVATLLRGRVLEGRVFTMDALLTQRVIAQTLVDASGHYVMIAKGNQPRLEADIAAEFRTPRPLRSALDDSDNDGPRPRPRRAARVDGEQARRAISTGLLRARCFGWSGGASR